uniref:Uncharacterized protein n=1 Tax=Anguilla anguilla TaxID=7936 RepID=A0A0E9WRD8_ANGAN
MRIISSQTSLAQTTLHRCAEHSESIPLVNTMRELTMPHSCTDWLTKMKACRQNYIKEASHSHITCEFGTNQTNLN